MDLYQGMICNYLKTHLCILSPDRSNLNQRSSLPNRALHKFGTTFQVYIKFSILECWASKIVKGSVGYQIIDSLLIYVVRDMTLILLDRPFHYFWVSVSGDRQISCCSETSCHGFRNSKVVKGSVGLLPIFRFFLDFFPFLHFWHSVILPKIAE